VIVNHNAKQIINIFRKDKETKGFTAYLPEGAEVVSGTLEQAQAAYPDYTTGNIVKSKTGELRREREAKRLEAAQLREEKQAEFKALMEQKRQKKNENN